MKRLAVVVGVLILAGLIARPVTRITLDLLTGSASTAGFVLVVLPSGQITGAQLGTGLTLNTTTNPPTLAAGANATQASSKVVATASQSWATPANMNQCAAQIVMVNATTGSVTAGDYTISADGGTITFATAFHTVAVGDEIQMFCYR